MRSDELIPGARDETTLTHRQPGAMGGDPYGADIPAEPPQWEDEAGRRELKRDGGGAPRERHHHDEKAEN
jgi:hypothetical protein